ncbi:hypothetical protein F-S17_0433 [Faustovirus]|nr:hypothetical protein F-LCD7_0436 [Faustovirus]QJX72204.1 hypothetical protein F-M6_0441 [Faustovirus]QJX72699.1 hypothetical protein F-S17_0433 [Faustovirus]QJX74209.1 hypothetical protein F-E9_456 [Faustovirus]
MGNTKSTNHARSKTHEYRMNAYVRPITASKNNRRRNAYLHSAFELLCAMPKFNLFEHIYVEYKFTKYLIMCQKFPESGVLPLTKNVDLIACNHVAFLAYDKSLDREIQMPAFQVLSTLVSRNQYHDITRLLLKKLVKYKIISKTDAREIMNEVMA